MSEVLISINSTWATISNEVSDGQCRVDFDPDSIIDDTRRNHLVNAVCNADALGKYGLDRVKYIQEYMQDHVYGRWNVVDIGGASDITLSVWYWEFIAIFKHDGAIWLVYRPGNC